MDPEPPASLLGPVTDSDRRRWQLGATQALVEILKIAAKHELPPLTWTVSTGVTGRVSGLNRTDAEMRVVFERWAEALGLARQPEHVDVVGGVHLRAGNDSWTDVNRRHQARVYVVADFLPDE